jgi:hypothetical protein
MQQGLWVSSSFLENEYVDSIKGAKGPESRANHCSSSYAKINNAWNYTSTSPNIFRTVA